MSHSRGLGSVGWCGTRTPTLAGWCSRCCVDGMVFQKVVPAARWGGVWVVLQKVVPEWGGVPKVGVVFQKVVPEWDGVPKVGMVFQKVAPESPTARWGGVPKVEVVFSKKLSQNPHYVYYLF